MQFSESSEARLIMADVNRRGSTVRDERPWVEPSGSTPVAPWVTLDFACRYRGAQPDVTSATMAP